jgi:hypothetical protein
MTRYYLRLPGTETENEARGIADARGMGVLALELGPDGKVRGLAATGTCRRCGHWPADHGQGPCAWCACEGYVP